MNREEKSRISRENITKAAFRLFAEKGYEATTTQEIILAAGSSKGAMYHHFKSKEEILRSITKELRSETIEFLEKLSSDTALTVKEKMSQLFAYSGGSYTKRQLVFCSWIEKVPFALLEEIRNISTTTAPYIEQIIKQGIENQEFACEYPTELAELLVLCTDVWFDPLLFKKSYDEICRCLEFLQFMLESMKVAIVGRDEIEEFKALLKRGMN